MIAAEVPLLTGTGKKAIGALIKDSFDEVRLKYANPIGIQAAQTLLVYDFFVEKFCAGTGILPTNMSCGQTADWNKPAYPLYIDYNHTGNSGDLVNIGQINNPTFAIDDDTTTAASILTTASIGTEGVGFCVGDALNTYPKYTLVSFDVKSPSLLDLGVLNSVQIQLLLDDVVVQTETGTNSLVGLNPALLTGAGANDRQKFTIAAKTNFNKVKISFAKGINVSLGTINVYNVSITKKCALNIECNQSYVLDHFNSPAYINYHRTGATGLVIAGNGVANPEFVLDTIKNNYAEITTVANVLGGNALSVRNAIDTFPKGTYAGFTIANGVSGLLDLELLSAIRITTYLNNVEQESKMGANLLNLDLLVRLIGPSHNARPAGFITTKPFDEVRITVGGLVSALTNVRVYGAFVDTRFAMNSNGTFCNFHTRPDFAVSYPGIAAVGNLNTNDEVPEGSVYGPAVANTNNPTGANFTLNPDGTYNFVSNTPGEYNYVIPVCYTNNDVNPSVSQCKDEVLKITIIDTNALVVNQPIVNHDVASILQAITEADTVNINVLANDAPGNKNGSLDASSVTINVAPTLGTAAVLPNGTIDYMPNINAHGVDSFWYVVTEQPANTSDSALVKVHIQDVLLYPVVIGDDYIQVSGDVITNIPANKGVLINDFALNDTLSLAAIPFTDTLAGKAIIVMNADGSFTVKPLNNYYGPVDFIYQATDGYTKGTGTVHLLIEKPNTDTTYYTVPDIAVSYPNVATTGNIHTNDLVPNGTTYAQSGANTNNPSGGVLVLNPDGTYTFTGTTPGVYEYTTQACYTINAIPTCKEELLKITLIDTTSLANKPIVNHDVATMLGSLTGNDTLTINVLANDESGNAGGFIDASTVSVAQQPAHGSVTVLPNGSIAYTPNNAFTGIDSFWYTLCEKPANTCDSAMVKVIVQKDNTFNIVTGDDFIKVPANKPTTVTATEGVLANDYILTDATLEVIPFTQNIPNVGSINMLANGGYTFTPDEDYRGSITITYPVTDGVDTTKGNLIILVTPPHELIFVTQPDFAVTYPNKVVNGNVHTNDNVPVGTTYVLQPENGNPTASAIVVNANGSYTFTPTLPGNYTYTIKACYTYLVDGITTTICQDELLTITVIDDIAATINTPIINPDAVTMLESLNGTSSAIIPVLANDGPGNNRGRLDASTMTIPVAPTHGTVTLNIDGSITYTPNINFVGTDVFWYKVCEVIPNETGLCDSAKVEVTVQKYAAYTLVANDDYLSVPAHRPTEVSASKGVLSNDFTLSPNEITAIPQTINNAAGTFVLNADGSYIMTPNPNYAGPILYTYQATDGISTVSATLHILVTLPGQPLPITLVSFEGRAITCGQVALSWETSKEENLAHYELEFSSNGATFETIATVLGKNEALGTTYQVEVAQSTAKGFYRLKIVDIDQTYAYSTVVNVTMNCLENNIIIYPNPTTGSITLKSLPIKGKIAILSVKGQVLYTRDTIQSMEQIDLSKYASGTYIVSVTDTDGTTQYYKVSKQD